MYLVSLAACLALLAFPCLAQNQTGSPAATKVTKEEVGSSPSKQGSETPKDQPQKTCSQCLRIHLAFEKDWYESTSFEKRATAALFKRMAGDTKFKMAKGTAVQRAIQLGPETSLLLLWSDWTKWTQPSGNSMRAFSAAEAGLWGQLVLGLSQKVPGSDQGQNEPQEILYYPEQKTDLCLDSDIGITAEKLILLPIPTSRPVNPDCSLVYYGSLVPESLLDVEEIISSDSTATNSPWLRALSIINSLREIGWYDRSHIFGYDDNLADYCFGRGLPNDVVHDRLTPKGYPFLEQETADFWERLERQFWTRFLSKILGADITVSKIVRASPLQTWPVPEGKSNIQNGKVSPSVQDRHQPPRGSNGDQSGYRWYEASGKAVASSLCSKPVNAAPLEPGTLPAKKKTSYIVKVENATECSLVYFTLK